MNFIDIKDYHIDREIVNMILNVVSLDVSGVHNFRVHYLNHFG
jgi:hypothetical protein